MKILSMIAGIILVSITGYSQSTCATSFKVNNGNGTCGAAGELRLNFPGGCPAQPPLIDSVYIDGVKSKVAFRSPDLSKCGGNNGYISYCVSSGNMPPANVWNIFFHDSTRHFNCTVVSAAGGVLPVKFTSFEAKVAGNAITCKWSTESEINNNHYELERSFDGNNFSTVAIIFSADNNESSKSYYSYKDSSSSLLYKNLVFYRVKQVDNDGKLSYTNVLSIKQGAIQKWNLEISPNPFGDKLSIKFESTQTGTAEIKILSITGQPIVIKNAIVTKGSNNLQLGNLGSFANGVYIAQVLINGVVAGSQKIVKN